VTPTERFEVLASLFLAEEGMAAPGKDVPAEMGTTHTPSERGTLWSWWTHHYRKRNEEVLRLAHLARADWRQVIVWHDEAAGDVLKLRAIIDRDMED
jgi:hypothetical protein